MKKQVVFVIIEDNLLGQIIQPFSVKILANKQWSVDVKEFTRYNQNISILKFLKLKKTHRTHNYTPTGLPLSKI